MFIISTNAAICARRARACCRAFAPPRGNCRGRSSLYKLTSPSPSSHQPHSSIRSFSSRASDRHQQSHSKQMAAYPQNPKDIELFYAGTPNGWKIEIALEEFGLPYKLHAIDIGKGDQFTPEFVKVNPNSKIPAIVDPNVEGEPLAVFESGAILIYLAQRTGKLLPDPKTDIRGNADVHQWLMWQMAGFGPMLGQFNHFNNFAPEKIPYAIERYTKEANRLFKVLDTQLATSQYVAKSGFSIADIAIFGWAALFIWRKSPIEVPSNVRRWYDELIQRPVFQKLAKNYVERVGVWTNHTYTDEEKKAFGLK